ENSLIYYDRKNDIGPKQSDFNVVAVTDGELLNALLTTSLGVVTVVVKEREIYFLKNVKFHLDTLQDLGCFVEIEASNKYADLQIETLRKQCEFYMQQLFIHDDDLIHVSYSDMLMA
ncbi:MAG: class IV adenylate cyclase, partial [Chitinophagaceae bacterium]